MRRNVKKLSFSLLRFNNILFYIKCIIKVNIPFLNNIMETSKITISELILKTSKLSPNSQDKHNILEAEKKYSLSQDWNESSSITTNDHQIKSSRRITHVIGCMCHISVMIWKPVYLMSHRRATPLNIQWSGDTTVLK